MSDRPLPRKGLSIERLRSFVAVADAGGIAAAEPDDPVRQSLVSRQIRELEESFGCSLTERRGRKLALTPAGEHLAQVARELFKGLDDVSAHAAGDASPYSLAAGDSLLHWWVIPRLGGLEADHRAISLTVVALSSVDIVTRLLDARIDLGLVRASEVPKGLRAVPLGELTWALFVPRRLHRPGASIADLVARVPLALQQSEPQLNEQLAAAARERRGLCAALSCETFPQACRAVESGQFAAMLPSLARQALPPAKFVELPLPSIGAKGGRVQLAWHPRTERTRADAASVIEALSLSLRIPAA